MNKIDQREKKDVPRKQIIAYSFGQFSDTIAYQMFTFLIFTFYYAVVGLNVNLITIGFVVWSIWNAFNDPLLGTLSDRTRTKWGRRKPYIVAGIIPLCVIMVLLWTPPLDTELTKFIYFFVIILLFELFYTMYSLNQVSLLPEMFQDLRNRAKANSIRQVFAIFGLIFAFILPTVFIPKLDDVKYFINYRYAGMFMSVFIAIGAIIFIKFGIKEREEFSEDYKTAPSFIDSLKFSLKNKAFRTYVIAALANWYVYGMLPTIVPLYGSFVLGIGEGESVLLALLLGVAFISAAGFIFLWGYVSLRTGIKKGLMMSMFIFIITLIPFMFISDIITGFIAFFLVGIGFSGSLFFLDVIMSAIVDYDELNTGIRREGGYFGIHALITRFSTIFIFLTISFVFNSVGWTVFNPLGTTEETIFGLRILMFFFPSVALLVGILSMSRFPITKEKQEQMKRDLEELHDKKKEKVERLKK